jgi:hypothetical protein
MDSVKTTENIDAIIMELRPLIAKQLNDFPEYGNIQFEIKYRDAKLQQLIIRTEKSFLLKP